MRTRLLAIFATLMLLGTACGSNSDDVVDADGTTTSQAVTQEEIRAPSRAGLDVMFGNASAEAAPEPDVCFAEECDDTGDVEIPDEPQNPPPTTTRVRLDYTPLPEHRPFCATLADIEEREAPDLESAAGQAIIFE
jgi:hypothetical protein